jgi:hypothetical protein
MLCWLNANSGAVTAIATAVTTVVTAVYALVTIFLWRATRAQARIAKEQAEVTRMAFEASHRPYVTMRAKEPADTRTHGRLSFQMVVVNQGPVPAEITAWVVRGTILGLTEDNRQIDVPVEQTDAIEPIPSPTGRTLAPHERTRFNLHFAHPGLPNPVLPFRLHVRVEYRGIVAAWSYSTDLAATRVNETWRTQSRVLR